MTPLPRAVCPTCGQEVALRRGGELREHRPEGTLCPASGYTVEQVEQKINDEIDGLRGMGR
jgi:hypothetical protein